MFLDNARGKKTTDWMQQKVIDVREEFRNPGLAAFLAMHKNWRRRREVAGVMKAEMSADAARMESLKRMSATPPKSLMRVFITRWHRILTRQRERARVREMHTK